jgi:subfamily B ATP-binding cassette protein MsbA
MQIPLISSLVHYYKVVYGYLGKKFFVLILIFFSQGITECFGVSMLLPILNMATTNEAQDSYTQAIYHFLEYVGIEVSVFSLLVILSLAFLLKGVFKFFQNFLNSYIKLSLTKDIRIGFCHKFRSMKYDLYSNLSIGYMNNLVTTETARAVGALNRYTLLIGSIVLTLIYIFFAFCINWKITILSLVICACLFAMLRGLSRLSRKYSIFESETNSKIQSLLIQSIYNFKYIKATNSFIQLYKQLFKRINENYLCQFKNAILMAIPISIVEPITIFFLSILVYYYVGYLGKSVAEVMVLLLLFYKAFTYIFRFQLDWQKFNGSLGGLEMVIKANQILNNNVEKIGSRRINTFNKAIELRSVNIGYGPKQVLFDVNLVIKKNKSTGIVGESGAGKTTLFDIITGLLTPQSGKISIDGIDYSVLELSSLRNMIGYVTQDPIIFNDTIANNISFWECDNQEDVCKKLIKDAAVLANCDKFINEAEMGHETIIGDKGVKLSGGQCQRIAIARELFKEPEIMIFDEATSSLDTESEQLIQQSINSLKGERTIVIIAHRLSTVRNCDYIYVLKEGRIVEEGSFDELYRDTNSRFYSMCLSQNL